MKVLHYLIDATVTEETKCEKKGFSAVLHIRQAAFSEVDLATRLDYDKKTVSRVLDRMVELGFVSAKQNNRTSIHTLRCISAWYVDGLKIVNPYYVSIRARHPTEDVDAETRTVGEI